jgi:TonB family protein
MPRLLRIFVLVLIPALFPLFACAQGPIAPHPAPAESARVDQDSSDGLQLRLQDLLNAAKDHDVPKLRLLIKQIEIPDYREWFTKTFGEDIGERMAEKYERDFADTDSYVETLFAQLASDDGEFSIRKVNARAAGGEPGEDAQARRVRRGPANPFIVTWKSRNLSSAPGIRQIGAFAYLDGSFRWVSVFRIPASAPGMSTYPSLSPLPATGNAADVSEDHPESVPVIGPIQRGVRITSPPKCDYCPAAEYSDAARKKGLEGTVVLQTIVQPDGSGTDIQVVKSPDLELTQMAMDTISRWRFKPARNAEGEPVAYREAIELSFRLAK